MLVMLLLRVPSLIAQLSPKRLLLLLLLLSLPPRLLPPLV